MHGLITRFYDQSRLRVCLILILEQELKLLVAGYLKKNGNLELWSSLDIKTTVFMIILGNLLNKVIVAVPF